ncbi:hypothetical protein MGMO_43c00200 [Methyloglobulus morosus KoM1]|uniref:Uncharacterized protein n=1 Tax=Methyloglobulus morosus KoM1 TaxID=1116472 RepID=V5E037_9GAMM|nr:hypothetical protein MGMO_43c00200 [Methyloglobulus morosus KoM1]
MLFSGPAKAHKQFKMSLTLKLRLPHSILPENLPLILGINPKQLPLA